MNNQSLSFVNFQNTIEMLILKLQISSFNNLGLHLVNSIGEVQEMRRIRDNKIS
jgi:hypothetical protein